MNLLQTPKGTLFRLFRETFITTSAHYYCPTYHIHMVKCHNVTKGIDEVIGEVAMLGAHPFTQEIK